MIKQLLAPLFCLLALTACGSKSSASRTNDLTPLTSIQIQVATSIANGTSTPVTVIGNFSGQFTRDITSEVTLTSSTSGVADFGLNGLPASRIKGIAAGAVTITATSARWGISATAPLTVTSSTISSLAISPASPSIPKGTSTSLTATGTFSDNSTQDLTFDATWTSDATTVATVSDTIGTKGKVQSVATGTATITATFGGVPGSTTVTVTPAVPTSIAITPANPTLLSISTTKFTATATYTDNTTSDITSLANWSSTVPSVATVSNDATTQGKALTLATGTTQIKASFSGVEGTTSLKVTGGSLTSVSVTPATANALTLIQGSSLRLTATGTFSNATTRDITGALTWASADTGKARITGPTGSLIFLDGIATTTTPVTVSATFGTSTINTAVTVAAPALTSLTISVPPADLTVGVSKRFTVTGTFSGGITQDLTYSSSWVTSNSNLLSVGDSGLNKGKVKALAVSSAPVSVTATYSGQSVSAAINTLTSRTLTSIAVTGVTGTLLPGNQVKATITATYSDNKTEDSTEDSTITISDPKVAFTVDTASLPGAIVGLDTGSATFSAGFESKTLTQTITVQ